MISILILLPNYQDSEFVFTFWIPVWKWTKNNVLKKKMNPDKDNVFSSKCYDADKLLDYEEERSLVAIAVVFTFSFGISIWRHSESIEQRQQLLVKYFIKFCFAHGKSFLPIAQPPCCLEIDRTAKASLLNNFLTTSCFCYLT